MKSLLASIVAVCAFAIALAGAGAQTLPEAQPSICPSPSQTNSLVDTTLQHNCVTPKPSLTPKPVATHAPPAAQPSPSASPRVQPTSKGVMR